MVQFWEVVLYSFLNTIPYKVLLLQPFTKKYRFSPTITYLITAVSFVLETLRFWAVVQGWVDPGVSMFIHIGINLIYCLIVIEDLIGKSFITFLILLNFNIFVIGTSKFFEWLIFPDMAGQLYRWTHSLIMIPVEIIPLAFDWAYSTKVYVKVINQTAPSKLWRYLWIIPMTALIAWSQILFFQEESYIVIMKEFSIFILLFVLSGGYWLADYFIAVLLLEETSIHDLEIRNFRQEQKERQFQNMNKRIADARRARHDMRHHLQTATAYLNENKIGELREYLQEYFDSIPNDNLLTYCENFSVNALLTYYQQRCHDRQVDYQVAVSIPEEIGISQYDLEIVFGNLVENAADAALEAEEAGKEAVVKITATFDGSLLMASIENTVLNQPKPDANGQYKSTKHSDYGIGISSAKDMAEQYGGSLNIMQKNDMFHVMVTMYAKDEQ